MGSSKTCQISLTDEVKQLKSVIRKKETNRTIKCRCQILLALDEAHDKVYTNEPCALSINISKGSVHNVIGYYLERCIERTLTSRRSVNSDNARRKLDGCGEDRLIDIACGPVLEGSDR